MTDIKILKEYQQEIDRELLKVTDGLIDRGTELELPFEIGSIMLTQSVLILAKSLVEAGEEIREEKIDNKLKEILK